MKRTLLLRLLLLPLETEIDNQTFSSLQMPDTPISTNNLDDDDLEALVKKNPPLFTQRIHTLCSNVLFLFFLTKTVPSWSDVLSSKF